MSGISTVVGDISFGSAGSEAHCRFRKFNPPGGCPSFALFAKGGRQLIAQSPCRLHKTLRTSGMQHTTWGLIVCWIYHGISHREIAGDVSCSMLRSYPLSPGRAEHALGGLPGDGLAAGAGRVHPSPGQAGAENAPGQIPITSMRPARLKARASHYWRNGFGGASAISAMPTMIKAGTSPSRCPCSPAFDNACTVMMPA